MSSFSLFHWIIVAVIVFAAMSFFRGGSGGTFFCTTCGTEGAARMRTRGSLGIEIVLWLMLIVPGLLYSLWRLTTRAPVCGACGAETIVPPGSPIALKMKSELKAIPPTA